MKNWRRDRLHGGKKKTNCTQKIEFRDSILLGKAAFFIDGEYKDKKLNEKNDKNPKGVLILLPEMTRISTTVML